MNNEGKAGYKKPPKKHQWKPGQSGNPSGKKKAAEAKPKPFAEQFAAHLGELVQLTIGGKPQMVTMGEALIRKYLHDMMNASLNEKIKGLEQLKTLGVLELLKELSGQGDEWEDPFTEEDRRLLAAITEADDDGD